jgi:hypothetical protein
MGEQAIEQDDVGGRLHKLLVAGVEEAFRRGQQQTEDQGGHRRDQRDPELYDLLRFRAQMMVGEQPAQRHRQKRALAKTQANMIKPTAIVIMINQRAARC